jgi:hypothetical protein
MSSGAQCSLEGAAERPAVTHVDRLHPEPVFVYELRR